MTDPARQSAWEESYGRRENFVFEPSDEVVRFVSRHLRRRVGLSEVIDVAPGAEGSRVLDAGCGIGRHLAFGTRMGLAMHGMDLSERAVATARQWLAQLGVRDAESRVQANDIRSLPWDDAFFAHALSDSVLDSMPFDIAMAGISEIARVVAPGGYFYCNFISGNETGRPAGYEGEEVVNTKHEHNTIQSYFSKTKIAALLQNRFEIVSCELIQHSDHDQGVWSGRWHAVTRRR